MRMYQSGLAKRKVLACTEYKIGFLDYKAKIEKYEISCYIILLLVEVQQSYLSLFVILELIFYMQTVVLP
jgi:hypothetical protein